MRLHYPASFPKLLLLGFALVALPPALALLGAFLSLDQLASRSEAAIARATVITRDSRSLGEHLTSLERLARQQLVLDDAAGLAAYERQRLPFIETLARLNEHAATLAIGADLGVLRDTEQGIWQSLQDGSPRQTTAPLVLRAFSTLNETAGQIVSQADSRIEADIDTLRQQSASARSQLLLQLLVLLPLCLVLATVMTWLIRRPVRQIEAGIRGLGEARFDEVIRVDGPHDMQMLGTRLDWLRTRLIELHAQQTRFLHHVSHELKTPLTALHEGTALLQDKVIGPLNTEQLEVVHILGNNCQRLRKLIENLLDYSSLRFQPTQLTLESVDLDALLARVCEDHKLPAAARNIRLHRDGPTLNLMADRDKLRVILDNLLSNALKFAPPDSSIFIHSALDDGMARIEICDHGPGIPPDIAPQVFEPFVQGPAPQGSAVKGSGLGLSIVRELVAAHGGEISLLPHPPTGTCARLRLPLTKALTA